MASLFSKIIAHELPADFVFEDDRWVAFMDIFPVRPGHTLLVPRHECAYLSQLPGGFVAETGRYLQALCQCVKRVTGAPDAAIILRDGPAAGQIIPHVHWHVVPRFPGDDQHDFSSGSYHAEATENDRRRAAMAAALRAGWRGR